MKKLISYIILLGTSFSQIWAAPTEELISNFRATPQELAAGAVLIEKEVVISIDDQAQKTQTYRYVYAILSDEASRDYSRISMHFNAFYEEEVLDYARVIEPNGTIKPVNNDAIQVQNPSNYNRYDDTKLITFSLPAIQPNSFIEFQTTTKTRKNVIPNHNAGRIAAHFVQSNNSTNKMRIDPVRNTIITLKTPVNMPLYLRLNKVQQPQITTDAQKIYTWEIKNLNEIPVENSIDIPYSTLLPYVYYSTMSDWSIVNRTLFDAFNKASEPNTKIKQIVFEITRDAATEQEKIEAIYHYIQTNIKYIMANFGTGGIIPHNASEIIENIYGDCKDQTVLAISMLKAAGITAYPSLVQTQGETPTSEDVPDTKHFNHVIVYIPSTDTWFDTTGTFSIFPGTHWVLDQKWSLQLNPTGGALKKIVLNHVEQLNVNLEMKQLEKKIEAKIVIKPSTYLSNHYKGFIANAQDGKVLLQQDFQKFYPRATMKSFEIKYANSSKRNMEIEYSFAIPLEIIDKEVYFNSLIGNLIALSFPVVGLEPPKKRVYGYKFGYTMTINLTSRYIAPSEGYEVIFVKLPTSFDGKYYQYKFSQQKEKDGLTVLETITAKKSVIPRDKYESYYAQSQKIFNDIAWVFNFKENQMKKEEMALKEAVLANNDILSQISLAEHYLDAAKYDEAKKQIEHIIASDANNAKAHYLYGVVLGYLDQFEQSDEAFKKAKSLGYQH